MISRQTFIWLMGGLIMVGGANAQTPQMVADGHFPDIAVDSQGNIHLVYGSAGLKYRKWYAGTGEWSDEQDTGCACERIERSDPDVVVDSAGNPHVICGTDYAYWDGASWVKISPGGTRDTELAIDRDDNVYYIHRGGNNGGYLGMKKRAPAADSWEDLPDPDANNPGRNDHVYPDLAISPVDNSVHVIYRHATPKELSYRGSFDRGNSWPVQEGVSEEGAEGPHIIVDHANTVYVTDGSGVFHRRKSDGGWQSEGRVVRAGDREQPELAVDRTNTVYCGSWGGRYNIRVDGQWIGELMLDRATDRTMMGFVEMAGVSDFAYIAWEEGNAGDADTVLSGNPVVVVARLDHDGAVTALRPRTPSSVQTSDADRGPAAFTLMQSYPNPVSMSGRARATVRFHLAEAELAALRVFDVRGRAVVDLGRGVYQPGWHTVEVDAGGLAPGVYFVMLAVKGVRQTRRVVVVR